MVTLSPRQTRSEPRSSRCPPPVVGVDEDADEPLPAGFALSHNYPNPFNPVTHIAYAIYARSFVKLTVYNVLGQPVKVLVNERKPAGRFQTVGDGTDRRGQTVASGIYFYRLEAGDYTLTRKMILAK